MTVLPRTLHPLAWWAWALGLAVAAAQTTNPLLLLALVGAAGCVVVARRGDQVYARAFRWYLLAGVLIVLVRVAFRVLLGGGGSAGPDPVLVGLPTVDLPWPGAPELLGDVTGSELLAAATDGLRLATMLVCVGAANALADPRRLLKSVPPALHEFGAAAVVAVSVLPQLAESALRVRAARRLRGAGGRRHHRLRAAVVPVLADAVERSLALASSMDARGYGRRAAVPAGSRRLVGGLLLAGLLGVLVGVYALLDTTTPRWLGLPVLLVGVATAVLGLTLAGRRVQRTRYRPDRWRVPELATLAAGAVVAATFMVTTGTDPLVADPVLSPPTWPTLALLPLVGLAAALVPAVVTPPPARPVAAPHRERGADEPVVRERVPR